MVVDIIFVIVLIYGFYLGYSRGIIKTFFTVVSFVVGLVAAFKFTPGMTNMLETITGSDNPLMFIAGFIVSFVLTMLLIRLFARGLEGILESVNINIINQVAGGVVLGAGMVLVYALVLWFADTSGILSEQSKTESFTYPYLEEYPSLVWDGAGLLRPVFVDFWDHTIEFLDRVEQMGVERTETDPTFYDIEEEPSSRR